MEKSNKIYYAAVYLRISKEDGSSYSRRYFDESASISSQRELIMEYLNYNPNIKFVKEFCDDGYSGTSFEKRPAFQEMVKFAEEGKINCIICKDLSRFGRDHIEAGKYLEYKFPEMGLRFIAVTDSYDSSVNTDPYILSSDMLPPPIEAGASCSTAPAS